MTMKELLAMVKSLDHFHPYLHGQKFLVQTDPFLPGWLSNFKRSEGQMASWPQKIQQCDLRIHHRPGKKH